MKSCQRRRFLRFAVAMSLTFCFSVGVSAVATAGKENPFGTFEPGEIVTILGTPYNEFYIQTIPEFEKKTGLRINLVTMKDWEIVAQMGMVLAAGSIAYDVVYTWISETADLAETYFEDLTDTPLWTEANVRNTPKPSLDCVSWKGRIYGVPRNLSIRILMYNKELFSEYGIPGAPATIAEYISFAQKLTRDRTGDGRTDLWGVSCTWDAGNIVQDFMCRLLQHGGKEWDEYGNPLFNQEVGINALQDMVDAIHKYKFLHPNTPSMSEFAAENLYYQRNAAMLRAWVHQCSRADDPEKSIVVGENAWTIFPGVSPGISGSVNGCEGYSLLKTSPHKAAVYEWFKFISTYEFQKRHVLETGWLPTRHDVLKDPEVLRSIGFADTVVIQSEYPVGGFFGPHPAEVEEIGSSYLQLAVRQKIGVKEALDAMVKDIKEMMEKKK